MPNYLPLPPRFAHHRELVGLVANAGVPAPAEWTELSDRLDRYLTMDNSYADQLAAAVVSPSKTTDLPLLRALAAAEQSAGITSLTHSPQVIATINATVVNAVEAEMLTAWAEVARANAAAVAAKFTAAAEAFHAAIAQGVDPESDSRHLLSADDQTRQNYLTAEIEAQKLSALLPSWLASTQLAGVRIDAANPDMAQPWWDAPLSVGHCIALCVETTGKHVRRLYEAWNADATGTRTGRWGKLAKLTTIRAADLDTLQPLPPLQPLRHRQEPLPGKPGHVHTVAYDPHDDKPTPTPVDPARPSRLTTV
jgi:hypothetical protein